MNMIRSVQGSGVFQAYRFTDSAANNGRPRLYSVLFQRLNLCEAYRFTELQILYGTKIMHSQVGYLK
jgi:hypothetical protein